MGRRPVIRNSIIKILKASEDPLEPAEIRGRVAQDLDRKLAEVAETNIYSNLKILVNGGHAEKQFIDGKPFYKLSNSFYKSENKSMIKSMVDSADLKDFIPHFEKNHPPLTAYFQDLDVFMNPERKKTVRHFSEGLTNWSKPIDIINRRMMESFTDLEIDERKGIKKLLEYCYWYGVQSLIKEFYGRPLKEVLSKNRNFSRECIENAKERGDPERIEAEKILIQIQNITEEVTSKTNLNDLLKFFQNRDLEIKELQNRLWNLTGEHIGAAEVYNKFLDFHNLTLIGLQASGLVPKENIRGYMLPHFRYLLNYGEVWDEVISSIISQFNFEDELADINDNLDETLNKIKEQEKHLWSFMDLPFRSKMFIVYLWGYPEIFEVSDKEFLPMFDEWFSVLKEGRLDHRSWIFDKKTVITLINSLKAVRRDKLPEDGIIDLVPWTIMDLYKLHPRGKDVDFWEELLIEINLRMQRKPSKRELCRHISAAIQGRYDLDFHSTN